MVTELVFLGTGAGMPSKTRNVTSLAVRFLSYRGHVWLFDCGEGTQHRILDSSVTLAKIERIFVTHAHGDHLFGLPGLLGSRSFRSSDQCVTLHATDDALSFTKAALSASGTHLTYPFLTKPLSEGAIYADEVLKVEAKRLDHGITSYGFRIVEADRSGALDDERLRALGIPSGPLYGQLKRGKTITLPDGRTVSGSDYVGPALKGRVITILGDTRPCEGAIDLARKADVLVHEATFAADETELANRYGHSTAAQAARVAREAGVGQLILTHISARYGADGAQRLLAEAQAIFPRTLLAHDLLVVPVPINREVTLQP